MTTLWLVTGSTGLIGRRVVDVIVRTQPEVGLLLGGRSPLECPHRARHLPLDLTETTLTLPKGLSCLMHLAGEKRDERSMAVVNVQGALRLVDAAARAGVRRVVHLSSAGVYGAPKHAGVVDESAARTPRNAYERSKHEGEIAVVKQCAALGLSLIVLQPTNVIGEGRDGHYPLLALIKAVARGWFRYIGRGDAWVNYVAVDDVAAAIVVAATSPAVTGTYILNTPAPLRQLVAWIAQALEIKPPERSVPAWAGQAAAVASVSAQRLLGRDLLVNPERVLELTNTTRYDNGAFLRATGFTYPLGIRETVQCMARRYRELGLL